jgi:Fur family transcriptional regulator, ferric uptake regulator
MTSTEGPAMRPTKQRLAVIETMSTFDDFRSAQEIHDLLARRGEKVGLEDGEAIYRRCSDSHHHHLVCRGCGRTVEVEGPTVERWTRAIAAEHGFTDVSHTLEIVGSCADCS